MQDLRLKLEEAKKNKARRILITTDGVFSMDGTIAKLDKICDLADEYGAMVHHDDCHTTGFMGKHGKGVHEYRNVMDRVDIITSTFGKHLEERLVDLHQADPKLLICSDSDLDLTCFLIHWHLIYAQPL